MGDVGVLNRKRHFKVLRDKLDMDVTTKEINDEDPKFEIGGILRISKYKTFLQKPMLQIGLKKFLWLKKVKNTVLQIYVTSDLKGEDIVGTFYKKEFKKKKKIKTSLELKKL